MLNFSDDGSARPEKAAFLWKWLMEHVRNKKKEQESTSVSMNFFEIEYVYKMIFFLSLCCNYRISSNKTLPRIKPAF